MAYELFSNSGVQTVFIPLNHKLSGNVRENGWQPCRVKRGDKTVALRYVQWQLAANRSKLFLAIDTSLGDAKSVDLKFSDNGTLPLPETLGAVPDVFIRSAAGFVEDYYFNIGDLVDDDGEPVRLADRKGQDIGPLPAVPFVLRSPLAVGSAKEVHLVVDFGNSRTGALLLETRGEDNPQLEMQPFDLINRYRMDQWKARDQGLEDRLDDGQPWRRGEFEAGSARWFSSRTCWATRPYLEPTELQYRSENPAWKGTGRPDDILITFVPRLFDDLSLLRMGDEAEDMSQVMRDGGNKRTGVSSPKRYLWAGDSRWLDNSVWYMADPYDRLARQTPGQEIRHEHSAKLQGSLLGFIDETDSDRLLDMFDRGGDLFHELAPSASTAPVYPIPPRSLMTCALYELLCQAYTYANSYYYRRLTGDDARPRRIASLTLSYPSGMIRLERQQFLKQARKAAAIFHRTLGKYERIPEVSLTVDEASAVHLTYLWSELEAVGMDARLWFTTLTRHSAEPDWEVEGWTGSTPAARKRSQATVAVSPMSVLGSQYLAPLDEDDGDELAEADAPEDELEIRLACIDIGGGTTDLMIARYWCRPGMEDSIYGEMLHRDGTSVAGDHLVKRLLEQIVVPRFAQVSGLGHLAAKYFGPETPKNREFRMERVDWMNRLFVPLAHRYLQRAIADDTGATISHTDPDLVEEDVLTSLERVVARKEGAGLYNFREELKLRYDAKEFDTVVNGVFYPLLHDYCDRIVEHNADIVLLAGQPSKLKQLQRMVRTFLPLHESRVIPMHGYYAGAWYPDADVNPRFPGIIADPKSAVVVGTAVHFIAQRQNLHMFRFRSEPVLIPYHWGIMNLKTSRIPDRNLMFYPGSSSQFRLKADFRSAIIGRRLRQDENAEAAPVFRVEVKAPDELASEIDIEMQLERIVEDNEEAIRIRPGSVRGTINSRRATDDDVTLELRTLVDERFFLDTGGLDNIRFK